MKNKKYMHTILSIGFMTMLVAKNATAAISAPENTGLPTGTVVGSIGKAISLLISFVGGLSVLIIIIAGIVYITSGGDSAKTETAKNVILYAIVGLVVSLLAWVIVKTVIGSI